MKNGLIIFVLLGLHLTATAQNPLSRRTQLEAGNGYAIPFFYGGRELLNAKAIRDQGLSYYAQANGTRKSVGSYGSNQGISLILGYYKPVPKVKGLMLGTVMRTALTGATPAEGGYEEGYYFNFITVGIAAKFYPFESKNLSIKGDAGLASVLSKNRFLNSAGEQNFLHQFGIGSGFGLELGYNLTPFRSSSQFLELKMGYQLMNTRVEVNGIGNDSWRFGALHTGLTILF
jgi:hypothetical protein